MNVTFVAFAMTAILWSFALLQWVFSRGSRRARVVLVTASSVAALAGAVTIAVDLQLLRIGSGARDSKLAIRITRRADWWQLDYSRPGTSFTTANELHVPAGAIVHVSWPGEASRWVDVEDAVCVPGPDRGCLLIAAPSSRQARFVGLWPPMWRTLPVVAEPPDRFEAWFQNEGRSARRPADNGAFLFVNSGCGYCHVIRGVSSAASVVAPDLTHFAARRTIAGTDIPISRGALTGWVVHSRGLKPGSTMPDNPLDPGALHPLITYLASLR